MCSFVLVIIIVLVETNKLECSCLT